MCPNHVFQIWSDNPYSQLFPPEVARIQLQLAKDLKQILTELGKQCDLLKKLFTVKIIHFKMINSENSSADSKSADTTMETENQSAQTDQLQKRIIKEVMVSKNR